ncbi:MAG: type I restriction-modification enzyme R subunit C-terminal domain-containing protein [Terriglobales bacterium]|jgi:type I restriction enzyme R subunit
MPITPEDRARENIDELLEAAGWIVQNKNETNLSAGRGVAVREFPMKSGHGEADYLLFVDSAPIGVVEAKKEGDTLTGVELQTTKYCGGIPTNLTAPRRPLPFQYQSTGVETRFTSLLEPEARSRQVFAFHRPETLDQWLAQELQHPGSTVRARLHSLPPLITDGLRPAQITAIHNLEKSLAEGRPRALIQMASGGGKTYTACNFIYRLIKHAGARRVLFLVDRSNLGRQTLKEFQQFRTPEEHRSFTELYNVQRMQSNKLDDVKVCITTIQRLYAMLQGKEIDPELEERSGFETSLLQNEPVPVSYNANLPIETFDFIVTDECHRSIYNLWRQVLEYYDAFIIGLTATPSKQTFGFFDQNLVMEYNHERAVADGVNVPFDVYRIRTVVSEQGSIINAGFYVDKRDRETRKVRWQKLDEDLSYDARQLDRFVVTPDQIRTIIKTFKERLFTEIFPGRTEVPKTLIFAKDDSHADDIVQIVREEFGKGNDFAQKITYRTGTARVVNKKKNELGEEVEEVKWVNTGIKPEDLLSSFRNSYNPRIAVTVDMIATGTDIRPLEIVFFMRSVRSRGFFEQMKGRGTRIVAPDDLQAVTPDARVKTHFIIVDAVGLAEEEMSDTQPLERKRTISFEKILEAVSFGNREPDVLSSLASRLARLDHQLTDEDRKLVHETAGQPLATITKGLVEALDPDVQADAARVATGAAEPSADQVAQAAAKLLTDAAQPIATNPKLRIQLAEIRRSYEQTIDKITKDELISAGLDPAAKEKAQSMVRSFEEFIEQHKDEITALQVLYSRPYKQRPTFKEIKELAETIERPPRAWTPERLWHAYETLDRSKVRGSGGRVLTDIVSLVRFAIHQQDELHPFEDDVNARFTRWMAQQEGSGRKFTDEQRQWLEAIRDHVATSLTIEADDFEYEPFVQRGGLGKAYQVFGNDLEPILKELNEVLVQ